MTRVSQAARDRASAPWRVLGPTGWMRRARCVNDRRDWVTMLTRQDAQDLMTVCKLDCPVIEQCGEYASTMRTTHGTHGAIGVWGGELYRTKFCRHDNRTGTCPICNVQTAERAERKTRAEEG